MPPVRRRLFAIFSALSLLLCAAVCLLWVRSYRPMPEGEGDLGSAFVARRGGRYTLESEPGVLALRGPPPAPAGAALRAKPGGETPGRLAAGLHNDQVVWEVEYPANTFPNLRLGPHWTPRGRPGTAVDALAPVNPGETADPMVAGPRKFRTPPPFPMSEAAAPLLAALEDPDRFVAAHVVLALLDHDRYRRMGRTPGIWQADTVQFEPRPDGSFLHTHLGLRAELRPLGGPARPYSYSPSYGDDYVVRACTARIDPAQLATIRDRWHRRLDVAVWSVPWWALFALTLALPAAWSAVGVRQHLNHSARRRRGLCPACGYDLRASPGRCPECGAGKSLTHSS